MKDQPNLRCLPRIKVFRGEKWLNSSSSNISQNRVCMDWVDRQQSDKGLYEILQLLKGSYLDDFPLKTLKLGWVDFHSLTFQLKWLDFQSNQHKKLAPVLSCFCNWLWSY